jgi:hypothetical protein
MTMDAKRTSLSEPFCITDGLAVGGPQYCSKEDYWKMRHDWERKPFAPFWNDALLLLRAKRFRTQMEFAGYFKKSSPWATAFKELVIRQGVLTIEEWKSCFARDKRGRPTEDPRTWDEQQARLKLAEEATPLEDTPSGFNIDGIEELIGCVLARMRAREFKNEEALARFYKASPEKVECFRNMIVGGSLVTEEEYQGLFVRFTCQRAVDLPSSWADLTLQALRPLLQKKRDITHETSHLQHRIRRY